MKTILIVDDQQGIRLLLEELFQQAGYHTQTAVNGEAAIRSMKEMPADCVLLDMKLPGMSGVEVLKVLIGNWPRIPVVMMTAYDEIVLIEQALQLGAKQYFTKPFDVFELRDAVNALFES